MQPFEPNFICCYLSRSKKRGILPALSELTNFHYKKKKETSTSSENDDRGTEGSDNDIYCYETSTESTSSDPGEKVSCSSCDDINKISRKQRTFAKMSVRRDKKKEKEKRERIDKNIISMEDFLNKHAEFIGWLEEEKHKTSKMSSPKMKTYFKEFMKLWNKRKLPVKYYRGSTDTESPCRPTSRGFSFDEEETFDSRKQLCKPKKRLSIETANVLDSPFSTFGKTPPKLLQSPSIKKLETHHENEIQNGYASVCDSIETGKEQILSEYQVPVKQLKCDLHVDITDSNKENTPSNVQPYSVTQFSWARENTTSEGRKDSDLSSDHFSSSSSQSTHSHDVPVYAQPLKPRKGIDIQVVNKLVPSQDIAPPLPPPLKTDDYLESGAFSSGQGDYKSIDMDVDLPPPPPPDMDNFEDDSMLNATLPPPPPPEMCQSDDNSIFNATLPPPPIDQSEDALNVIFSPGYAEIGDVHGSSEGEWKPPSASKIYSPRKFKLTKSSPTEKVYSEVPPPVAPKPKRKMFFESVYIKPDDTYVEMNSGSSCVTNEVNNKSDEGNISYSDYAIPVDVVQNVSSTNANIKISTEGMLENKDIRSAIKVSDTEQQNLESIYAECYDAKIRSDVGVENSLPDHNTSHHYEEMNCNIKAINENKVEDGVQSSEGQPKLFDQSLENETKGNTEEIQMRNLIRSAEPHIFRTSGKGSSQVFNTPLYCSIEDMVEMDSKQNSDEVVYDQIENSTRANQNGDTLKVEPNRSSQHMYPEQATFQTFYSSSENKMNYHKTKSAAEILETDLDSIVPEKEVKKTMKRVKSSETIIW